MSSRLTRLVLLFAATLALSAAAAPLMADDLRGTDKVLCTAVQATVCFAEGECFGGPPWNWNIPEFIEIDLKKEVLATTAASGENRTTPIRHLERADGMIVLQGVENGRDFSFMIAEETGRASIAVARAGVTVAVFGSCTPR